MTISKMDVKNSIFLDVTAKRVFLDYARREYVVSAEVASSWCFLTVPRDVELDEVLEVLDVRRQPLDLVVAQPKLAKSVQTEEVLQKWKKSLYKYLIFRPFQSPFTTKEVWEGIELTLGRSRKWFASSRSSSRLRAYLQSSSGTTESEQCRLSTYSTCRLHPLKIGMHLNMAAAVAAATSAGKN